MKLMASLLILCTPLLSQQADTKGACSPANIGDRNIFVITCGIGKAQGDQMLKILNKILANQLDPETVMGKLDEIFEFHRGQTPYPRANHGVVLKSCQVLREKELISSSLLGSTGCGLC